LSDYPIDLLPDLHQLSIEDKKYSYLKAQNKDSCFSIQNERIIVPLEVLLATVACFLGR
jgi:hypothetical protein